MSLGQILLSEFSETAFLILLGVGAVAASLLAKPKGKGTGQLVTNFGWGLAVFTGVYVAYGTGGHLNPAVILGLWVAGKTGFVSGVSVNATTICTYIVAQLLDAFVGTILAWLVYRKHYDRHEGPAEILGIFSVDPEIRSYGWNLVTEAITTLVLMVWALISSGIKIVMGPFAVVLVIVAIGASFGDPTGYAISQVRDLGPHIIHTVLPIKSKDGPDWVYAWVPVVGPTIDGILAGPILGKFDIMDMMPSLSF